MIVAVQSSLLSPMPLGRFGRLARGARVERGGSDLRMTRGTVASCIADGPQRALVCEAETEAEIMKRNSSRRILSSGKSE